jgi:hypothetical protein
MLDRRKARRWRGLCDGQGYHRAPHSLPHQLVPKILTLSNPKDLALTNGGTAVVRGRSLASLTGDRAVENHAEQQHDEAMLTGQKREETMDQRVLATTLVTTAELRRGELAAEKTMRAYRGSAAALT